MRAFYKQILSRTYEIFGVNQLEKMSDEQVTYLLDTLERVSELYPYLSKENQQKIINKRLITDKEYRNINARLISGWFDIDGKVFFQESAHKQNEVAEDYKPLEGTDREAMLKMWENTLKSVNETFADKLERKGSGQRLRENLEGAGIVIPPDKQYKPFMVEGLEIFAQSEQQAREIYEATVTNETNQAGNQGAIQDTEIPTGENSPME